MLYIAMLFLLTDGRSQDGYILFLVGSNNKYMPIVWESKHIRRVVKNTLAADTLAMSDMSEAYLFDRNLLLELLQLKDKLRTIKSYAKQNFCLYDSAHLSIQSLDWDNHFEGNDWQKNCRDLLDINWYTNCRLLNKKGVPPFKFFGFIGVFNSMNSHSLIFFIRKTYYTHLKGKAKKENC